MEAAITTQATARDGLGQTIKRVASLLGLSEEVSFAIVKELAAILREEGFGTEKRTYTVKELAAILDISENACYKFVKEMENEFRTVRIGTTIRVSKVSFDEWLDRQGL